MLKLTPQQRIAIYKDLEKSLDLGFYKGLDIFNTQTADILERAKKEFDEVLNKMIDDFESKLDTNGKRVLHKMIKDLEIKDGEDGRDGARGEQGPAGPAGKDGKDGKSVKGDKGEPGKPGPIGLPGKPGKEGSPDKPLDIAKKLNTLDGVIDQKVIKGLPGLLKNLQNSIRERKAVNKGAGGGMGNWVHQVFSVTSATTSVTLSNNIAANGTAIMVRYQGQLLAHGVQYSISSRVITLNFTPDNVPNTFIEVTYVRA
jgi:hypothetical protein